MLRFCVCFVELPEITFLFLVFHLMLLSSSHAFCVCFIELQGIMFLFLFFFFFLLLVLIFILGVLGLFCWVIGDYVPVYCFSLDDLIFILCTLCLLCWVTKDYVSVSCFSLHVLIFILCVCWVIADNVPVSLFSLDVLISSYEFCVGFVEVKRIMFQFYVFASCSHFHLMNFLIRVCFVELPRNLASIQSQWTDLKS